MIDIETEVFSTVSEKVREQYPKIFITGEYVKSPSSFPCVSLIEVDNQIYRNTRTTESRVQGNSRVCGQTARSVGIHSHPYDPCSKRGRRNRLPHGGSVSSNRIKRKCNLQEVSNHGY